MASAAPTENTSLTVVEEQPKRGRGRPSLYTPELAAEICERIAGNESLLKICQDDNMPDYSTIGRWLMRHEEFSREYARARDTQMHLRVEEMHHIADNAYEDYYIDWKDGPDGTKVPYVVVNNESVRRAQLRIATRQWEAERLNRRTYSPSVKVEHDTPQHQPVEAGRLPESLSFLAGNGEEGKG